MAIKSATRSRPNTLFTLFGVPWTLTRKSPQFLVSRLIIGAVISFLFAPVNGVTAKIGIGLLYGLLLMLVQLLHTIGHTIGGKLAGAPMSENQIRDNFIATLYDHVPTDLPRRVHLIRTLGGPLMNIMLGVGSVLVWKAVGGHALRVFAAWNLIIALIVLMPIRTFDGEILWRLAGWDHNAQK